MHNQDQSPTTPLHHISARPALDSSQHKRGVTKSIVNFVEIVQSAILTLTEAVRIIQHTRPQVFSLYSTYGPILTIASDSDSD
jgi:hypothetical protein